jgi:hypothetical protein
MDNSAHPQLSQPIGLQIASPLFSLPRELFGSAKSERPGLESNGSTHGPNQPHEGDGLELSLPYRDLRRGQNFKLPTGREVAKVLAKQNKIEQEEIIPDEKRRGKTGNPLTAETPVPLWIYILAEAELVNKGTHLGPVGSRIVAEVFVGLLDSDAESYIHSESDWKPDLFNDSGQFGIADLLRIAEDESSR